MRRHILAAVALACWAQAIAVGAQPDAGQDVLVEREDAIVVNGTVVTGHLVLPAVETGFRFKLAQTGDVVSFHWKDLVQGERRRVRKLYGLDDIEDKPPPVKAYEKWMKENPPGQDDAAAHVAMARRCAMFGLYPKALEHLRAAEALGPLDESGAYLKRTAAEEVTRQQVEELYEGVVTARNSSNYGSALYGLRKVPHDLPVEWPLADDIARIRAEVETKAKEDIEKAVIQMSYAAAFDVLKQRLAKEPPSTFEQLKAYVCDTESPDGLKMQMLAAIAETVGGRVPNVKDVFGGRFPERCVDEDVRLIKAPVYAILQDANYGPGSWLREGSKPTPLTSDQLAGMDDEARKRISEDPELTDDPNVWWRAQNAGTRLGVLKALMGEKVFRARVKEMPCFSCAGAGLVSETPMGEAKTVSKRCSACRGTGRWWCMMYQ